MELGVHRALLREVQLQKAPGANVCPTGVLRATPQKPSSFPCSASQALVMGPGAEVQWRGGWVGGSEKQACCTVAPGCWGLLA